MKSHCKCMIYSLILFYSISSIVQSAEPKNDLYITTVAGDGSLEKIGQPFGVEFGPNGGLYICEVENHRISRLDPKTQKITIIAGTGTMGYSGDGGLAINAQLNEPYEIRFDKQGNLFFVEMINHIVRRIDAKTNIITTVAGNGTKGFGGDNGPAKKAQLNRPHSIALDNKGGLFIADIGNHRIRRVDLNTGTITTIAGTGHKIMPREGQVAQGTPILGPRALFIKNNTLWIALREGHSIWSMDLDKGSLEHIAGTGKQGYTGDGEDAKVATFDGPKGIAIGSKGQAYVVDTENQVIRKINTQKGIVSTIAGIGPRGRGYSGDNGPSTNAELDRPHGVCVDADGAVYIGDTNNNRIRKVTKN
jgi:streptogramin lyase